MSEPIAIVRLACRFPGADSASPFWQPIKDGVDAIGDIPAGRFDAAALYVLNPGARGKIVARQGGVLRDVDRFDPSFFRVSAREVACIDPQRRLLLEVNWEAIGECRPDARPAGGRQCRRRETR
jgi:acyl transferase domain-containing protein